MDDLLKNKQESVNIDMINYYIKSVEACTDSSEDVKVKRLLEKLDKLKEIPEMSKAKEYVATFLPTNNDKNYFHVGDIKGMVLRNRNIFRVIVDSEEKYICYNYIKKE